MNEPVPAPSATRAEDEVAARAGSSPMPSLAAAVAVVVLAMCVAVRTPPGRRSPDATGAPPAAVASPDGSDVRERAVPVTRRAPLGEVAFLPDRDESSSGVRYGYGRRSFSVGIAATAVVFGQPSAKAAAAVAAGGTNLPRDLDAAPRLARFRMDFVGGASTATLHGEDAVAWRTNEYRGDDAAAWREGVPNYRRVRASGVLPGVDVVYRSHGRQVAFDFVVAPGADPSAIALAFAVDDDTRPSVRTDAGGILVVTSGDDTMRFGAPVVFQEDAEGRAPVAGRYALRAVADGRTEVAFEVGCHDRTRPLVIDPPTLAGASYLGGKGDDSAQGVEVAQNGDLYVLGLTTAPFFPQNSFLGGASGGDYDVVLARIARNGAVLGNAVIGGSGGDYGYRLAQDPVTGRFFVGGQTYPPSGPGAVPFPATVGAYAGTGGGFATTPRAIVARMNAALELEASAVIACNDSTGFRGICAGSGGVACAGISSATNLPTSPGAAHPDRPAGTVTPTSMVMVLSDDLKAILAGTWIGEKNGNAYDVARKRNGNLVVVGFTSDANAPVVDAPQSVFGGKTDGYWAEFNGNCTVPQVWTYVGGPGFDYMLDVNVPDDDPATAAFSEDAFAAGAVGASFPAVSDTYQAGNDILVGCVRPGSFRFLTCAGGAGSDVPSYVGFIPGGFAVQSTTDSFPAYRLLVGAGPGGGASDVGINFFDVRAATVTTTGSGLEPVRFGGSGTESSGAFDFIADDDGDGPHHDALVSVNTSASDDAGTTADAAQPTNLSEGSAADDVHVAELDLGPQCPKPPAPRNFRVTRIRQVGHTNGFTVRLTWDQPKSASRIVRFDVVDLADNTGLEPLPSFRAIDVMSPSGRVTVELTLYLLEGSVLRQPQVTAVDECGGRSAGGSVVVVLPDLKWESFRWVQRDAAIVARTTNSLPAAVTLDFQGTATVPGADVPADAFDHLSPNMDVKHGSPEAKPKSQPPTTKFDVTGVLTWPAGSKTASMALSNEGLTVPVKFSLRLSINGRTKSLKFTLKPPKPKKP